MDFTPTPEQIERGLKDDDKDIQSAWICRLKESMLTTDEVCAFNISI
jgi:hypothetical protein